MATPRQDRRGDSRRGTLDLSDLDGPLSIGSGGTGATNSSDARDNFSLGSMATQSSTGVAITGGAVTSTDLRSDGNLVISKSSGVGLQVDTTSPSFGWVDLLSEVRVQTTAPSSAVPSWTAYIGNIKQYQFSVNDVVTNIFHVPHDYVPGTDMYIHVHWSHILTTISTTGTVSWDFEVSYAKGYNQAPFATPVTQTLVSTPSTDQYQHMIPEVILTGGTAASTSHLITDDIEVDGLILVNTALSATSLSGSALPFAHFIDIHYQSNGMPTKWKNTPFYST